ncbi:MAG: CHRD domain-containing protein [Chloroflexi bacterium]|nr:CHRD domain-containing protein [Chloroflexota bacterium]
MDMLGSLRQLRRILLALTVALALGAALVLPAAPAQAQWWSGIWVGPWPWLTYGVPATGFPLVSPLSVSIGALPPLLPSASISAMPMGMDMGMGDRYPGGERPHRMRGRLHREGALRTTVLVYDGFVLPSEITIPVGTTVTWLNRGTSPKSVTSPGVWDSGTIPPNGRYSAIFAVEGTFAYSAGPGAEGRITVTAAPPEGVPPERGPGAGGPRGGLAPSTGAPQGAMPAGAGTITATATLQPERDSGVTGDATLSQSGNTTTVTVRLRAPSGGTAHAGHIHAGSCSGPVLFPLETIQLDASGQGTATSTVNAPIDTSNWWVQYHQSVTPPGPGITCGQVMASR